MVNEIEGKLYACSKCGKQYASRSGAAGHERKCGSGINVKVGDRVVDFSALSGKVAILKIIKISGKTIDLEWKEDQRPLIARDPTYYRKYDEQKVNKLIKIGEEVKILREQFEEKQREMNDAWRELDRVSGA